jgi:ADP-ribosylglycohydrolase
LNNEDEQINQDRALGSILGATVGDVMGALLMHKKNLSKIDKNTVDKAMKMESNSN